MPVSKQSSTFPQCYYCFLHFYALSFRWSSRHRTSEAKLSSLAYTYAGRKHSRIACLLSIPTALLAVAINCKLRFHFPTQIYKPIYSRYMSKWRVFHLCKQWKLRLIIAKNKMREKKIRSEHLDILVLSTAKEQRFTPKTSALS